jgi:RHS repeat-associated protein
VNEQEYDWDDNGNLLDDGTNTYTYAYNGLGDRLSQTVDSVTTKYTLDISGGLSQVLNDGTSTYLYGYGRIGELQTGGFAYYLDDHLASVRQIADAAGNIGFTQSYEPFGSVLSSAGGISSAFGYAGEQLDTSGLIFLRARYYNSEIGRFFQKDLWNGNPINPSTQHLYLYAINNPIFYTDPFGRWPWDSWTQEQQGQVLSIATNVAIGVGVGLVTAGACALTAGIGCIVAAAAIGVVGGAYAGGLSTAVYNSAVGNDLGDNVVENAIIGGVAGGVGSLVGGVATAGLTAYVGGSAAVAASLSASAGVGILSGLVAGGTTAATGQLAGNIYSGRPWHEHVAEAGTFGAFVGGVGGGLVGTTNYYVDRALNQVFRGLSFNNAETWPEFSQNWANCADDLSTPPPNRLYVSAIRTSQDTYSPRGPIRDANGWPTGKYYTVRENAAWLDANLGEDMPWGAPIKVFVKDESMNEW